ncbi:glycosyltransferase family 4 protein [candidate division WOR-3 bacterium]|nr:glycosyltransferase family 4 protein [candidate division WOR-3 bacterium]
MMFNTEKNSSKDKKLLIISSGPALSPNYYGGDNERIIRAIVSGLRQQRMDGYFKKVYTSFFFSKSHKIVDFDDVAIIFTGWIDIIGSTQFSKLSTIERFLKYLHMLNPLKIIQYVKILFELKRLIKTENITFIEAGDPHISGITAYFLSKLTNRPFMLHMWNSYDYIYKYAKWTTTGLPRFIEKLMERFVFKRVDMIWTDEDPKAYAIKNGASIGNCYIVRGAVDNVQYSLDGRKDIREELDISQDSKIIIYVSRLSPEKFSLDVIKAFDIIKRKINQTYLIIAGEGELQKDMELFMKDHRLDGRVKILGFRDQAFLRNLYYTADIVLSPLTGNSLVEACLSGTPVVAYDCDWQPEVIKHMVTGLLVDFRDIEQLADEAIFLLENPEIAKELGTKGREFAIFQHSPNNIYQEKLRLWEKLGRTKK